MSSASERRWQFEGLSFLIVGILILAAAGCGGTSPSQQATAGGPSSGGGTGSAGGPGSGGGGTGSGGNTFQPRPFPGDFFIRVSPEAGNGYTAAAAYDPKLKEVFVSDPNTNAVKAYSSVDSHLVGEIHIPGPAGLSFSPDYSQLIIGTITPYVYIVDPVALHVARRIEIPVSYLALSGFYSTQLPVVPYALADGTIMIGLGSSPASSSSSYVFTQHLVLYDPTSGMFSAKDPGTGAVFALPARSVDGRSLLVLGINNSSTTLFLYSSTVHGYVASAIPLLSSGSSIASLAVNADGSQFAAVIGVFAPGADTTEVNFWGPNLQAQGQYSNQLGSSGGVFSRDGTRFFLMLNNNRVVVLNTQTASPAGYLGAVVGSSDTYSQLFDIDENFHLFGGPLFAGMFILNASQFQASPPAALPDFPAPSAEGSLVVGPLAGGGLDYFGPAPAGPGGGDGIDPSTEAYFGSVPSPLDTVTQGSTGSAGYTALTATIPPATAPGPVSIVLTDSSNNAAFLPDSFTYGPHLLRVGPNAVSAKGGDTLTVSAYGLGEPTGRISGQLTFGVARVDMQTGTFDPFASFAYPEQTLTVKIPAGTPGWADINISNDFGSDTLKRGLQYLSAEAFVKGAGYDFAVYDPVRDRFYLTGSGNTVAVFDPHSQAFLTPLQSAAVSSSATLFGEALTPDSSKLLVSDPNDHMVVVFDLVAGTSAAVNILLKSDATITLADPMPIEAAANNRAFVSMTPCLDSPVREINLANMAVQARPDAAGACATNLVYPKFGGESGDGSTIVFAGNSGFEPPGPEYVWGYDAATDSFRGPLLVGDAPWVGGQISADGDGQVIALSQGTLDQRLLPLVPFEVGGVDSRLNETGSLLYSINSSVVISDTHNGRALLTLGLPNTAGIGPSISPYRPLAIDPTGKKILVATPTGVSYFELSVIPLAAGTVSPDQGPAGTNIQIRGSGFVSGTTVQIGDQNAICAETDTETLSCTIPDLPLGSTPMNFVNPDGQTYSLENAFLVQ